MIRPLPPTKQLEFRRWLLLSVTLCSITIVTFLLVMTFKLYTLVQIKKDINSLTQQLQQQKQKIQIIEDLNTKIMALDNQKNSIEKFKKNQRSTTLLSTLSNMIPQQSVLTRFSYAKKNIELSGIASNQKAVIELYQQMNKDNYFKDIGIISLKQISEPLQYSYVIKATVL